VLLAAFGCGPLGLDRPAEAASPERGSASSDGKVAVVIEGDPVTVAELDAFLQRRFLEDLMRQPEEEIFEARERAIQELVQQHVVEREARARDLTADELFEQITASARKPTEEEIASWYQENQSRLRGANLEQVGPQIGQFLLEQRRREAWQAFVEPRLDALSYEMVLDRPRKDLEATRLVRGPVDAPVTLMAFSDYQCPFCIRSEPVLAEVLSRFPEKLRLVHRHFPLENVHPFARPASEAAMCADEQGRFWAYHDAIFARGGRLEEKTFGGIADELDLDREAFDACVEERRYAAFVEQDIRAGEAAGVTGTPAFFVNGIPLKGARDADELSRIVESELKRLESES
jgi:predicted DsbA family dithiol-disulfide isomerase